MTQSTHGQSTLAPTTYRNARASIEVAFVVEQCRLGSILVARSELGLCAILLGDDPDALGHDLRQRFPRAEPAADETDFSVAVAEVVRFVDAPATGLGQPLDVHGTVFQRRVWQALRITPVGETVSYGELAVRIGAPAAVRAVAGACAANLLAVAIPCHRVVGRDGSLTGYRWGVERKRALLASEALEDQP